MSIPKPSYGWVKNMPFPQKTGLALKTTKVRSADLHEEPLVPEPRCQVSGVRFQYLLPIFWI